MTGEKPNTGHAPEKVGARSVREGLAFLARLDARVKLACLIVYVVAALHARTFATMAACICLALVVAAAVRLSARDVKMVLVPLAPILIITAIMQVLYVTWGNVLLWLGPIAVTDAALFEVVRMVLCLAAIMVASVSFMRCTTTEELVRTLRWLLSPLAALGLRVDAFMLSLSIAFRFAPVLVTEFRQLKRAQSSRGASFEGGVKQRLDAHARVFAPLVRSSFRKADTLAEAFLARCFACGIRPSALHEMRVVPRDIAALALVVAFAVAVFVIG